MRHDGHFGPHWFLDPTSNGTHGSNYLEPFYYVWESIVRYKDGAAQINLLLNRASPWLDIDSHLPYEGKVVIKNKTAKNIALRVPRWVSKNKARCHVNEAGASFFWVGNYLMIGGFKENDIITVEFPMVETTETYCLVPFKSAPQWHKDQSSLPRYIIYLKGNTCVKVEFPNKSDFGPEIGYPVYQREHYKQNKAPGD